MQAELTEYKKTVISADKPITDVQEDELGRRDFAEKLAQRLISFEGNDSIVVALYGPWGSGKTSLLNLTVAEIERHGSELKKKERPIIIHFNPWYFSDQEQLLTVFLGQLLAQLNTKAKSAYKVVKDKLSKYGSVVTSTTFKTALSFIPAVAPIAEPASQALGHLWEILVKSASTGGSDVEKLRKEVDNAFADLRQRVIVVMDDLDRLTSHEICQVFQLVKLTANFPKTTYVIAADRKVLETSLNSEQGISGRDYLEKIVQVGFNIPAVHTLRLRELLNNAIGASLGEPDPDLWDQQRWSELFNGGFKQLFSTLRAVKRYANSLSFNHAMVASEVNPIDFIGIEAIRVFEPEVYQRIANNKLLFCGRNRVDEGEHPLSGVFAQQLSNQELRQLCDDIFECASETNRDNVRKICTNLFPNIARAYENTSRYGNEHRVNPRQQRRVCSEDVFDTYFLLGTPEGEVSRTELLEFKKVLETASLEDSVEFLNNYIVDQRAQRLLELFGDIQEQLSADAAEVFATVLIQVADSIPNLRRKIFEEPTEWTVMYRLFTSLGVLEPSRRKTWLEAQLAKGTGLYYLISLVSWQRKDGAGPIEDHAILDEQMTSELEAQCVVVIRKLAERGQLLTAKGPDYLLSRWQKWTKNPDEVKSYVTAQIETQEKALEFFSLYTRPDHPDISKSPPTMRYQLALGQIGQLLDYKQLDKLFTDINDPLALPENYQHVLDAWKRTVRSNLVQDPDPN